MKEAFSRFLGTDPDRLHAAAHSHHPWPDVSYEGHMRAWEDAARLMDDKWDRVFDEILPSVRRRVAATVGLPDPETLVFAPNTHEFVVRIAADLAPPFRVLTTDSEFHSFSRQMTRWEEAGIAEVTLVTAEPFDTFPDRFTSSYDDHDLVFFSHVHFNSGYAVPDLDRVVAFFPARATIVVDGYHGFMAIPTDLSAISERAFYMAGGYKYAMAGEGVAFLAVPPAAPQRPVNTGWFAGFGGLTEDATEVPYASGGQRYAGATSDPSGLYRLDAVLGWLEAAGVGVDQIHAHVRSLQERLIGRLDEGLAAALVPGVAVPSRGHFLTFRLDDAKSMYERLRSRNVITDYRGDRWRVGLGIYHDEADVDRLAEKTKSPD